MSNQCPQAAIHSDIDVRRHLLHLRRLHALNTGAPPPLKEARELYELERRKKRPAIKEITTIRLSPEVLAAFRATGRGWQTRIDKILCEFVKRGKLRA